MEGSKKLAESSENNFMEYLWFKFFPFWPLFAVLSIIFFVVALLYVLQVRPTYQVSATMVINNEENPTSNNQSFRALNAFASRQIVDNEVLVLQSRALMKKVVNNLHLYAPIFEKKFASTVSAYLSSPVIIEAKEPDKLQKAENIALEFDKVSNSIKIENDIYPLNKWISFSFGTLRFIRNPRNTKLTDKPLYFSIVNTSIVADNLLKSLEISAVSKVSTVINITYKSDIPEKGEDIVNELLKEYKNNSVANENFLAANTLAFVEERLREVEQDMDSIERRIEQFRSTKGVIDLNEQGRIYLQNVAENDRKITDINAQIAVLIQVQRYVNTQDTKIGIVPTTLGIEDPVLAQLLQRLNTLELQLANAKTTTGENNPLITSIENEIQKIRPNISSIVINQKDRLLASRNNLITTSNRFNTNIRNVPQQERELLEISRQQAVKKDLYSFLLQRREEAALSNQSTIADNRIIDWADASVASMSTKRIIILLASFVAAFAVSLTYIFYKEAFNSKIIFNSELENLTSAPVVAEIIYKKHGDPLSFHNKSNKALTEQFRQMQVALGWFKGQANKQKTLVTSSISNEGKTFISINLALSLALSGKKVILLDFNLQNPETSILFNFSQEKGIKDFLQSRNELQEIVKKTQIEYLDLIPAGSEIGNSVELLLQNKLTNLFEVLQQHYDYIIIDTPPVEVATDAYILSHYCDFTLFVIRHGITPKTFIQRMDNNPRLEQLKNLNIVFNGVKGRGFVKKYYGYGYGYGNEYIYV